VTAGHSPATRPVHAQVDDRPLQVSNRVLNSQSVPLDAFEGILNDLLRHDGIERDSGRKTQQAMAVSAVERVDIDGGRRAR